MINQFSNSSNIPPNNELNVSGPAAADNFPVDNSIFSRFFGDTGNQNKEAEHLPPSESISVQPAVQQHSILKIPAPPHSILAPIVPSIENITPPREKARPTRQKKRKKDHTVEKKNVKSLERQIDALHKTNVILQQRELEAQKGEKLAKLTIQSLTTQNDGIREQNLKLNAHNVMLQTRNEALIAHSVELQKQAYGLLAHNIQLQTQIQELTTKNQELQNKVAGYTQFYTQQLLNE